MLPAGTVDAGLTMPSPWRPRVAVFAGPTATILNTPDVVFPDDGRPADRPQRLVAPAVVYVDAWSSHPLAVDSRGLTRGGDGWLDRDGTFHPTAEAPDDAWEREGAVEVRRIELDPGDGLVMLPGTAAPLAGRRSWGSDGVEVSAPKPGETFRQTFFPDAATLYEEIDRFGIDAGGRHGLLSALADFSFFRPAPSGGYQSAEGARRAGLGGPERRGRDFFNYFPRDLRSEPGSEALVTLTNEVQRVLDTGHHHGAQWLEGSPTIEETLYWLNLVIDTEVPIVGHSAQRPHRSLGSDGGANVLDGVRYIASRAWSDERGRDRIGAVLVVDSRVLASRDVVKVASRGGGYLSAGLGGGAIGGLAQDTGEVRLTSVPAAAHTHRSAVRMGVLPGEVAGVHLRDGDVTTVAVPVRSGRRLMPTARPAVDIVAFARFADGCCAQEPVQSWMAHALAHHPLSGLVAEGQNPFGWMDPAAEAALRQAVFCGLPVVKCGRGHTAGVVSRQEPWFVRGVDLPAGKARILLMASLLRFGALPPAADPTRPTDAERRATIEAVGRYQAVFDTH